MSRGLNKVMVIGHLGADPEVRYTADGKAIANVRLATSESWKDKNSGEAQERTEWHRVTFFGRLAEIVAEYLKKGSQIYVEGKLRTTEYEKDGAKRWSTDIVAEEMQMLGGKQDGKTSEKPATRPQAQAPDRVPVPAGDFDEFIPF